ncbi:hypothetical protein [Deinococcus misasensis]|uniref:hypothetical protein n=1 Tax=Deinococcus misasensis TaxID=392413 RepID=UPI0012F9A923|nr:hypothetical protein [Deinococcus misasensis]
MHKLTFYPSGNADTTLVDINNNSKKMLIDFADRSGDGDKYCKLSELLKADLEAADRTSYNVVAFTHADQDHTQGADEFFHFDSSPSRQGDDRIKIDVLWVPAAFIYESQRELCTSS